MFLCCPLEELEQGRMMDSSRTCGRVLIAVIALCAAIALPELAIAQASPFLTGANSLQTNILAWLTPVAIILIMVLGGLAMANRMSWGWCIGAVIGIAIAFGAPQIVTWVRGMFGV
jgi:type IV secretion system protein VirB2